MKCDRDATLEIERWEVESGGELRARMYQKGVFEVWSSGVFTEVDPPNLLAYTLHADPSLGTPEMQVRVELTPIGDSGERTRLELTQSGIPDERIRSVIDGGWTNSLGLLEESLRGRNPIREVTS